jgi:hypothetical protein
VNKNRPKAMQETMEMIELRFHFFKGVYFKNQTLMPLCVNKYSNAYPFF